MNLTAAAGDAYDDGYCTVIGFAEQADGSGHSIILSIQNEPEEQDFETGTAGIYVETDDGLVAYDLVADLQFEAPELIIRWWDKQRPETRVDVSAVPLDAAALQQAVERFRERLTQVARTQPPAAGRRA